uniref:BHLH domain-containing protein n=1 Tax=Meloidogyne hapla TaxID=6305 RepID=A0A1I8BYZ1_MELHA
MFECSSSSSWLSNQQNNSSYSSSFSPINSSNLYQSISLNNNSNNFYLNNTKINLNSKQQKLNKNGKEKQKNILSKRKRNNKNNLNVGIKFGGKKPHQVARRNERERKRVQQVNDGYEKLANTLNNFEPICNERKLTKAETLKTAILYIKHLEELLKQQQPLKINLEKQNKIKNENNIENSNNFYQNLNSSQENQKEQQFLTKHSPTNFIYSQSINTNYNNTNNNNIYLNNNSFQNCLFPSKQK